MSITHLPIKNFILLGHLISNIFKNLTEKQKKVLISNIFLKTHMEK